MTTRIEIDVATGIESIIELTPEELAELEVLKAASEEHTKRLKEEEEAKAAAKASAEAKLAKLGLTPEEIAAL